MEMVFVAKLTNVVQLSAIRDNDNVFETINTYLVRKGQNSKNTMMTYERSIRDFFQTMRNKSLEELLPQDLVFNKKQIESYQVTLREQYKGVTVNNSITALYECYKRLEDNGFPVNANWFRLERYDESDSVKYGTLSHEEVLAIIDFVSKTRKGDEKALLIRLAYATAFRKDSLLNLEWKNIVEINGLKYIKTIGKGNKPSHKKLSNGLYDLLMKHKEKSESDKIFQLTKATVQKMMNKINESMDFGDRHIVFHSFKKASINEVNLISGGDIKLMQAHGDHSEASTLLNSYLADKLIEDLVVVDVDNNIPTEKFEEMTKEELVEMLKKANRKVQIQLLQDIGAM